MTECLTTVLNLETLREVGFTLPPKEAVIAAYAQFEQKDFNSPDYMNRYGNQVSEGEFIYTLGDWAAFKDETITVKIDLEHKAG